MLSPVFLLTSILVIVIPGPNVLVLVATSLQFGLRAALLTLIGTASAMAFQLTLVCFATSAWVSAADNGLSWLKWSGVIVLTGLAIQQFVRAFNKPSSTPLTPSHATFTGFWVALSNPKTLVFFSAFLPQFVAPGVPYIPSIALLSIVFWVLATGFDALYVLAATSLRALLTRRHLLRTCSFASAVVYTVAALFLALKSLN